MKVMHNPAKESIRFRNSTGYEHGIMIGGVFEPDNMCSIWWEYWYVKSVRIPLEDQEDYNQ